MTPIWRVATLRGRCQVHDCSPKLSSPVEENSLESQQVQQIKALMVVLRLEKLNGKSNKMRNVCLKGQKGITVNHDSDIH